MLVFNMKNKKVPESLGKNVIQVKETQGNSVMQQ